MIPASTLRILRHIATLGPEELTAIGPVVIGTEGARTILSALDDAETLRAVRSLLDSGKVSAHALRALLSASSVETGTFARKETAK